MPCAVQDNGFRGEIGSLILAASGVLNSRLLSPCQALSPSPPVSPPPASSRGLRGARLPLLAAAIWRVCLRADRCYAQRHKHNHHLLARPGLRCHCCSKAWLICSYSVDVHGVLKQPVDRNSLQLPFHCSKGRVDVSTLFLHQVALLQGCLM